MVRVAASADEGATVSELPLESLLRGGLFTPPALDAFLRVLSVGSLSSDRAADPS